MVRALALANATSCHETAQRCVEELRHNLSGLEPQLRRRALPLLMEAMLVLGDQHGVVALAEEFSNDLLHSPRALDLALPCLGDRLCAGGHPVSSVAKTRLNATLLAARWETGQISGVDVLRRLARHPLRLAMDPMLELLVFNVVKATHPDAATRALGRFLAAYGLPPLRISRGSGPLLGRVCAAGCRAREARGPLVSVIVAALNARHTIEYAIDSLLAQSYENLEVLACDDASADGTFDVLRQRYGSNRRVRLFQSPERQGTYNIRNCLIPLARGSLVTFHDADDWALPDRLGIQVSAVQTRSVVACLSSWVRVREDGTVVFFRSGAPVRMSVVSLMMSKEHCQACGPFRSARLGADFEFYQMLRARYGDARIARIHAPLILSLWSGSSLTRFAGAEALETGYRSPARRAYCELASRRALHGSSDITDAVITAMLRRHHNPVAVTRGEAERVCRSPLLLETPTVATFRTLLHETGPLLTVDTIHGPEQGNAVWSDAIRALLVQAAIVSEHLYATLFLRAAGKRRRVTRASMTECTRLAANATELVLELVRDGRWLAALPVEIWTSDSGTGCVTCRGSNLLAKKLPTPLFELCYRANSKHLALSRLYSGPTDEERPFDVDFVYTWVDHRDPTWRELIGRYRDIEQVDWDRYTSIDEMLYSLRSVAAFAPWVHKIFIVTNCAPPAWMQPHPLIEFVPHEAIFPPDLDCLPSFSSHAIESCLGHVPNLSEHFVYFNDDVFLATPVTKAEFFEANGCSVSYLEPYGAVFGDLGPENPDYLNAALNGRELIRSKFGRVPTQLHRHAPHALRRSVLLDMEREFPEHFARVRQSRFRQITDISVPSFLYHHYAFQKREAVRKKTHISLVNQTRYERELRKILGGSTYTFFCLNDGDNSSQSAKYATAKQVFLREFLPKPGPWETDG